MVKIPVNTPVIISTHTLLNKQLQIATEWGFRARKALRMNDSNTLQLCTDTKTTSESDINTSCSAESQLGLMKKDECNDSAYPSWTISQIQSLLSEISSSFEIPIRFEEVGMIERDLRKIDDWVLKGKRLFPKFHPPKPFALILKDIIENLKTCINKNTSVPVHCICRTVENGFMVKILCITVFNFKLSILAD